ncbi:MAG: 3-deoxy-D-manno-octulosonic acid transferase [Alphaproteobacteria bacterium]|nr:3-deoxy-D-manno-octulosonic acid transferase [Alphaproteobacteria bacterium]
MLKFYTSIMTQSEPLLNRLLRARVAKGKENAERLDERRGISAKPRPDGHVFWVHAASVGEAQSALILVHSIIKQTPDAHILVTTGTQTSAKHMEDALPARAFHQFIPLDHPQWVARFLDHWCPDAAFWMESELWPNMLSAIKARNTPAALINARLSKQSLARWRLVRGSIATLLSTFDVILAQSDDDAENFMSLGARDVVASGNLKYSAAPLGFDAKDLAMMRISVGARPVIVYASTHDGEESIAADLHGMLEAAYPDLLSIIIPRHPNRGAAILVALEADHHNVMLRGADKVQPDDNTSIYIADTMGEMGLFYRLGSIVYVGRSLSADGGGGHNPLEPAQLHCAVVHGKHVQNLADIYDDMQAHNACISVHDQDDLLQKLEWLLSDDAARDEYVRRAYDFANAKGHVIDIVLKHIQPIIDEGIRHAA